MSVEMSEGLDQQLDRWRGYVTAHAETSPERLAELEDALRPHAKQLLSAGLSADEAFLIALRRVSEGDEVSRAYVREYANALLAEPDATVPSEAPPASAEKTGFLVMLACALAAAAAIKVPALFGYALDGNGSEFYLLNIGLLALPFLVLLFAWLTRPPRKLLISVGAVFVAGAVVVNAYPFVSSGSTQLLSAIHLPIVLWLAAGVVAAGSGWRAVAKRMEYTRFTGEWFITYTLIALGGGVLSAITIGVFEAIGMPAETFVANWLLPCGAMGAVVVAAWLVQTRPSLVGGFAPMLARVFTPLFTALLIALVVAVAWTRGFMHVEREVLILFDVLLALVLALLLYAISARDPHAAPGWFDRIQLALVASALVVDVFALVSIAVRLSEFGFSANKVAALGLNVILLVNLAWSAWLQTGFLGSRRRFEEIERWQMRYLPVYATWAAIVVVAFPLLFGFK